MPDAVVQVAEVKAFKTKSGNARYVLRDADGNEYTTFREEIARSCSRSSSRSRSASRRTSSHLVRR